MRAIKEKNADVVLNSIKSIIEDYENEKIKISNIVVDKGLEFNNKYFLIILMMFIKMVKYFLKMLEDIIVL